MLSITCELHSDEKVKISLKQLPAAAAKKIDFKKDIQPLFKQFCYDCHSGEEQEAGLKLDSKKLAMSGSDNGIIISPGNSLKSPLLFHLKGVESFSVMPPEDEDQLTDKQIGLVRAWIEQGAVWPDDADVKTKVTSDHWSFQPIKKITPPKIKNNSRINNPIDLFIQMKLEEKNIKPSPEADRTVLLRRLTLDLTGLLPTVKELNDFLNDQSENAYAKVVDRLLNSPHFGERWGKHWLDKARYADSDGYEKDRPRINAWRYRDWVIKAINEDIPFTQFTIEQIAGDLLDNADEEQILATAFHRQTLTNTEGGVDQEEFRVEAIFDRVETIGSVWLGLTVTCARCHTHKYDPIMQREYYELFAYLDNGDEVNSKVTISKEALDKYHSEKPVYDRKLKLMKSELQVVRETQLFNYSLWEEKIQKKLTEVSKKPLNFFTITGESVTATNNAKLKKMEDGSWLIEGDKPDKSVYTIQGSVEGETITGIKIELIPDESLPAKGPGTAGNGNLVLSKLEIFAGDSPKFDKKNQVKIKSVSSDFSQKDYPAKNILDNKDKTGWAIMPQVGKPHELTIVFGAPIDSKKKKQFQIKLHQLYGGHHLIGRFRVQLMSGEHPDSVAPKNIRNLLAIAEGKRTKKQNSELLEHYYLFNSDVQKQIKQIEKLKKIVPKEPTMVVRVINERVKDRRKTKVFKRGSFLTPLGDVEPSTFDIMPAPENPVSDLKKKRLELARWLVSDKNPLTPRVTMNYLWVHLFGQGIVTTVNDFGIQGESPSHPELLDWLANEFIKSGWSRKKMIRIIVSSAAYQQSSSHRPELLSIDPVNKLLYRQNRFRVEGEIIRDISLAASGLLSRKKGGPAVFPPMPGDVANLSYANNFKWKNSTGEDRYRRGIYTFIKRTALHPNLSAFDCPDANVTCVQRRASNTPIQALTSLNNEVYVEVAKALAKKLLTSSKKTDDAKIEQAFISCLSRKPNSGEKTQLLNLLNVSRKWYRKNPESAKKVLGDYLIEGVNADELASWVIFSRTVLNLDEFMTRG